MLVCIETQRAGYFSWKYCCLCIWVSIDMLIRLTLLWGDMLWKILKSTLSRMTLNPFPPLSLSPFPLSRLALFLISPVPPPLPSPPYTLPPVNSLASSLGLSIGLTYPPGHCLLNLILSSLIMGVKGTPPLTPPSPSPSNPPPPVNLSQNSAGRDKNFCLFFHRVWVSHQVARFLSPSPCSWLGGREYPPFSLGMKGDPDGDDEVGGGGAGEVIFVIRYAVDASAIP